MYHKPQTKQRGALVAALCAIALLVAGAAPAAETAARITAVAGGTNVDDAAAEHSAALEDDASVQTADDGNCAMLVDEDALVELCSSTIMTLTRKPDTGNRVVKIDAGTTRVVVEPRSADEYIEIHTPAAIATIMGTTVFVEVDPVTGGTKITSDNLVRVTSSDPNVKGSADASNMEQITIMPGQAPSQPKQMDRTALANLGGCLVDFHQLALSVDRGSTSSRTQNRMALGDGQTAALPVVAAAHGTPTVPGPDEGPPEAPDLDPFDSGDPGIDELPLPEPCDLPGDGCIIIPSPQLRDF